MKDGKPAKIVQKAGKLNRKIKTTLKSAAVTVKMENNLSIFSDKDQQMSASRQFVHIYSSLFIKNTYINLF